jgi:hypothetical protein
METIDENPSFEDILIKSQESIHEFVNSLGPDDVYRDILLEELLKILLRKK